MKEITNFAKIHQYDDRNTYKEAWKIWYEVNNDYLNREVHRLASIGYEGSVEDKMFKAGRYYFRKKGLVASDADGVYNTNETKKQRRVYISIDSEIINLMDEHLNIAMQENNFTPADGYNAFCKTHMNSQMLRDEIKRMISENANITSNDISSKIKKTYKNRYYLLSRA